ncbi:MAG: ATP-binding protein [Pseudomonadales bacterium]
MIALSGYTDYQPLQQTSSIMLVSATQVATDLSVVLKFPNPQHTTLDQISRIHGEYETLKRLDSNFIPQVYDLTEYEGVPVLVLENIPYATLEQRLLGNPLTVADIFKLAQLLTQALDDLHSFGVIYKNLNPANILVNEDYTQLRLINFGLAVFENINQDRSEGSQFEVAAEYISPEQTGRLNSAVDYRTDIYSLGTCLYQLATGRPPFSSDDFLDLIFQHLAREPEPPSAANSAIPHTLDKIILKLLEKEPGDRYQSTYAISSDLKKAEDLLAQASEVPENFAVALDDVPEQLSIANNLLQRETQLNQINALLNRAVSEPVKPIIVRGESGVGKTSVLRETVRRASEDAGIQCLCRAALVEKDIPYNALTNLLTELSRQLLLRDDLSQLQSQLYARLGDKLEYLIELCPELQKVLGRNFESPALNQPLETHSRLYEAFRGFILNISEFARPLILCFDDAHWIDPSSAEMFANTAQQAVPGLVFIYSVRSDLTNQSILTEPLDDTNQFKLDNLNQDSVKQLLTSCLYRSPEEVEGLAEIVHQKTRGNPLAVREFLNEVYRAKHLFFDRKHREWNWDIDGISMSKPTNNVGEVLAQNLGKLDRSTLEVLKIAACIGDEFSLDTVKRVSGLSFSESSASLIHAVSEGFLLYSDSGSRSVYKFAHQQIQQAAYQLMNGIERGQIHAQIGRTYLSQDDSDHRIFEVVNQLNNSLDESNLSDAERLELAQLNLNAGQKAKQQAAFQASFRYLRIAIAVQGKHVWDNYELSMRAHLEAAEAAYFCGDRNQLIILTSAILSKAKTALEKTRAYEIQLKALISTGELDLAIEIGNQVLELLNQKVPTNLTRGGLALWSARIVLKARFLPSQTQQMTDPEELAAMRIMRILSQAGYLASRFGTAAYAFKMTELSLDKGPAPESSFAFPLFGAIIIRFFGTISLGYEFGQRALDNLHADNREMYSVTHAIVHSFVSFWKQNLRATLEPLNTAEKVGFELGDIEFAQIAGTAACLNGLLAGQDLNTLDASLSERNARAIEFNQQPMLALGNIFQQTVQNLLHDKHTPWLMEGPLYTEGDNTNGDQRDRDNTSHANLYVLKTALAVIFRQRDLAFEYAKEARSVLDSLISSPLVPFFTVFESLAVIWQLPRSNFLDTLKLKHRIRQNIGSLRKWSQHAPMNNLPGYQLILAEVARMDQRDIDAANHYEQAMSAAEQYGQNQMLAIAQESTGRFYETRGSDSLASYYLIRCRSAYLRWGAAAKVQQLDEQYRDLAEQGSLLFRRTPTMLDTTEQAYGDYLDLGSVIKASQALSGEIILATLLEKLMQVALENAGANAAGLVLSDGDELWVEILSRYNGVTTDHKLQRHPLRESQEVPASVLKYVARTEEDLVLNDATNDDMFTQDNYIVKTKPRSILCVPILSKSHLTGVLYLENSKNKAAFSEDRVAVLRLLASQSAIAIENAKLYQQLNESRDKYLSLYENAVEGIFEIGMDGVLISVNPAAAQLIGFPDSIYNGKRKMDFASLFVDPEELKVFSRRLLAEQRVVGFETQLRRMDGKEIWVAVSAHIIYDKAVPDKIDGSIIDITERKLRQQAEQATRMAEAATATKSQFLANMSHEIRTPMNAILGYTRLALETELDAQQQNYLQTIKNSSDHLLRVVNDILDISKIESGKLELQSSVFDLNDVLNDVRQLFRLAAEKKNLQFDVPNVKAVKYKGDAVRLGQVLINLVSNAIKFTDKGKVSVSTDILPLHDGAHSLNFVVSDTGCGIPADQIESIFDSFSQAGHASDESGTGLGLTISRNIIQMMNGHIHVSSAPGTGSKFFFTVVLEPAAEPASETNSSFHVPEPGSAGTILLVEDNPINRNLAREILVNGGYEVVEAEHGQEALDLSEQRSFSAILMDLRMPVMSGNEAIIELRKREQYKDIPVIALSAGVLQHEIDAALENGFDHYITKPVDFEKLMSLLAEVTNQDHSPALSQGSEQLHMSGGATQPPALAVTSQAKSTAVNADRQQVLGVDFGIALENHDHDEALLNRLLDDFIEFYADAPEQLNAALTDNRLEVAGRLVHNLAGLAGTFGANSLMTMCRGYEKSINGGETLSHQQQSEFTDAMQNFVDAIKIYRGDHHEQKATDSQSPG